MGLWLVKVWSKRIIIVNVLVPFPLTILPVLRCFLSVGSKIAGVRAKRLVRHCDDKGFFHQIVLLHFAKIVSVWFRIQLCSPFTTDSASGLCY
jgi:hypothetical protein